MAYLQAHGNQKMMLKQQICSLRNEIATWMHGNIQISANAFDWEVEFIEVFTSIQINGQTGLTEQQNPSGFDIVLANPPYVRQELIKELKPALKKGYPEVYTGTADLYVYFYARAWQLLKPQGVLAFISSNKWMRTAYGEKLRTLFLEKTKLLALLDFKGKQIFKATVDTNILICAKAVAHSSHTLQTGDDLPSAENQLTSMLQSRLSRHGFNFGKAEVQALKAKIEARGVPLKDWEVSINFGVKTGFNEAFIIDTATKEQLCQQDPKSAKIIKPFLRGRDIKHYGYEWAGVWLINTHNGVKSKGIKPIDVVKSYPAIYEYLRQFETELIKRQDKGDHWTNLRNCAYFQDFEQEKIVYPIITTFFDFAYDKQGFFTNDKTFIMTGKSLKYLVAFFNSKLFRTVFKDNFPALGAEGREVRKVFFDKIPVLKIPEKEQQPFITMVDQILSAKRANPQADTSTLETTIDKLVYEVYGLTAAEIALVEERPKK